MKFTPILLTTALALAPCTLWAETFNPDVLFSPEGQTFDTLTPRKGTGFATTDASMTRYKFKDVNAKARQKNFSEFMGYGLTDRWTLYGQVSREWDKLSQDTTTKSKMDHWFVGTGYRFIDDGKNLLNGVITYGQKNYSFGGGVLKGYSVYGIYSYNFDSFYPHTVVGWNQFLNLGDKNDEEWYWYGGASVPLSRDFSLELGIDYDRQASASQIWKGYASISYLLNDFITTELYGQYVLSDSVKHNTDNYETKKQYTFGLRLTTSF